MSETSVPTIMDIVGDLGGSGEPETIVDALKLLHDEVDDMPADPMTNAEIDAITEN